MIDIHCHILPDLDDGPTDWEESLRMAALAAEDGIEQIVCTPHYIPGLYTPSPEAVLSKVRELNLRIQDMGLPLSVHSGMEVYLDHEIPDLIHKEAILSLLGRNRYLLLELPLHIIPVHVEEIVWALQVEGITPILAHIERYPSLRQDPMCLNGWLERGVLMQVTGASLLGRLGPKVRDFAFRLLDHRMVHFLATDAHGAEGKRPYLNSIRTLVAQTYDPDTAADLVSNNPHQIIADQELSPPAPIFFRAKKKGWGWKRLFSGSP